MTNLLDVQNIEVIYDQSILALKQVSLAVPQGAIVALLGGEWCRKKYNLKGDFSVIGE